MNRRTLVLVGGFGRLGTAIRKLFHPVYQPFEFIVIARDDLELPGRLSMLEDLSFDVLINCAAFHKVDLAEGDPARAFAVNAQGPRALAALCARKGAHLIHVSTDYVFDGHRPSRSPYAESDRPRPLNVYGASKLSGEALAYRNHDKVSIVRVASLFGQTCSAGKGTDFVQTMLAKAKAGTPIAVVDSYTMSPTSATDAAKAIMYIARDGLAGTWHTVNSGAPVTWHDYAREILKDKADTVTAQPPGASGAVRPLFSALNNRRLRSAGFVMPEWRESLAKYLSEIG